MEPMVWNNTLIKKSYLIFTKNKSIGAKHCQIPTKRLLGVGQGALKNKIKTETNFLNFFCKFYEYRMYSLDCASPSLQNQLKDAFNQTSHSEGFTES